MFKSKKVYVAVATVAMALLLLTGTFAWQQMVTKTNEFIGMRDNIKLHDDFDPRVGVKDVYVENQGDTTVFVRVKLNEAMNLQSYTWRPAKEDWVAHTCENDPVDCTHVNAAKEKFHDYFTWEMGGSKYYKPATGSSPIIQDINTYVQTDQGVRLTQDAKIITIANYLGLASDKQKDFIGWIYDTDGYAYWSQPLTKDQATGLLLHKVMPTKSLVDTDYYYAIDVLVESVDAQDIPMWTKGDASIDGSGIKYPVATTDGQTVIGIVTNFS